MTTTTTMTTSSADIAAGIVQLKSLDRVLIRERTPLFTDHKYVVLAEDGAVLLYAREDCALVSRVLGGKSRAFEIDVFDTHHREVMKLRRPYSVGQEKLQVTVCGVPAAVVRREVTLLKPVLTINDPTDRPVIRVKGPVSTSGVCDFELYSAEKQHIGAISKRWSGLSRPGDGDSFAIRFPPTLDVRYKAAIIATCFLIDFLIFDN